METVRELCDLAFSDLYLGADASWIAGMPGQFDPVRAPEEHRRELSALRTLCETIAKDSGKAEFTVRSGGAVFRAATLNALNEEVFVLRRAPAEVPEVRSLGIHAKYIQRLMTPGITGLVIIAGSYSQGKTTTASALIKSRISQFGGVAVTIEDPPEMPLEGRHGAGVCFQTWTEPGGFGTACRRAARWAPSIIFLGEIRDPESATEALRASINGRLVVCTTHADSIPMAAERIYSLANGVAGSSEDVSSLLANGLLAILHQKLETDAHGRKAPRARFLWLGDEDDATSARHTIKTRNFSQLNSEVERQLNRTLMNGMGAS